MRETHKKVKKQVQNMAVLSSPLLAAFGISPIFATENVRVPQFLLAFSMLTLGIGFFWLLNILLKKRIVKKSFRLVSSFGLILLLQIPTLFDLVPVPLDNEWFKIYPLVGSMAINGVIILILDSIYLAHRNKMNEMELQDIKFSKLESEKQLLIRQLQPHFLFNALTTLKSLIETNPLLAKDYTVKLSEFLRYSIRPRKEGQLVTLQDEMKFTEDYVRLQMVRFGDALNFKLELPDEILHRKVLSFALQTLVENAIKHNKATKEKPLGIRIFEKAGFVIVENNKMKRFVISGAGTGLANLNERYILECNSSIIVEEAEAFFSVKIPLI